MFGLRERVPGLPAPPWIVAHRGDSAHHAENSLAAIRSAVAAGAHALEVDLQLAGSGEIVVFHDWDTERLCGRAGILERLTAPELGALRVGGEAIPTLGALLDALPAGMPLNLELKRRHAPPEGLVDRLAEAIADRPSIWVSSFDRDLLGRLRERLPDLPLAPLSDRDPAELLRVAEELGAVAVHAHRRLADELVADAGSARLPLLVYTVNDPEEALGLLARGVAGVFTDDPGAALARLRERPSERPG